LCGQGGRNEDRYKQAMGLRSRGDGSCMLAWVKNRLLGDERGFSLVEMMAALTLIAVGFFALIGTASTGARMLAEAKQRQSASEIASRELEHLRNIPYDDVALGGTLARATDQDDPDWWLHDDGSSYDHDQNGSYETLIMGGSIEHATDTSVGTTDLRIYRYVTWVDDPAVAGTQDYKRLVLIAYYRAPVATGRPREVRVSTLFTPGSITVAGSGTAPTQGVDVPVSDPGTLPGASCVGDTSGPTGSFTIVSGTGGETGYTASETVTIQLAPVDDCTPITIKFTNDLTVYGDSVTYSTSEPTATWRITAGDGSKNVWAQFKDGNGTTRIVGPSAITLDQTLPTVPGTLTRTVSCSGTTRTVNLSWGTSTDTNLIGYRLYRSVDSEAWEVVSTTTSLTASNTHAKTLDSVRFRVTSYDQAGNESPTTNEITLSKNQCS